MRPLVLTQGGAMPVAGEIYSFHGARGRVAWPMQYGAHLGSVGMWNFLWRLGFQPQEVLADALPTPSAGAALFAQLDSMPSEGTLRRLRHWAEADCGLILAGDAAACAAVVDPDGTWEHVAVDDPYAALAYVGVDALPPMLMTPSGWAFTRVPHAAAAVQTLGHVASVSGERQSPSRALVTPAADAPAIVRRGDATAFLNASPFAALQAWLQGQEDLQPWMAWRQRLHWLDEWVSQLATVLANHRLLRLDAPRKGIADLAATTTVLRHDVDDSRDAGYVDDEESAGIAATHAVLLDRRAGFWRDRIAATPSHECAFHYTTGRRDWSATARTVLRRRPAGVMRPSRRDVTGTGLLRQVQRARAAGIGVATLHRHLAFLLYPEWIDALDTVLARDAEVLGGSSLFRAQVLRWGRDRIDGRIATVGEWPDAQFPFWLPFRVAHAGDGGRTLRGWESTSLMEPEPELVEQVLAHRLPHLAQRVFTFNFHPAHAAGTTFHRGGSRPAFRRVLRLLQERSIAVLPLRDVYRRAAIAAA